MSNFECRWQDERLCEEDRKRADLAVVMYLAGLAAQMIVMDVTGMVAEVARMGESLAPVRRMLNYKWN